MTPRQRTTTEAQRQARQLLATYRRCTPANQAELRRYARLLAAQTHGPQAPTTVCGYTVCAFCGQSASCWRGRTSGYQPRCTACRRKALAHGASA